MPVAGSGDFDCFNQRANALWEFRKALALFYDNLPFLAVLAKGFLVTIQVLFHLVHGVFRDDQSLALLAGERVACSHAKGKIAFSGIKQQTELGAVPGKAF